MSDKFRWVILLSAAGVSWLSGNWMFMVGWVLFEWALVWRNLTSRKPNDLFDEVMEKAVEIGFKIESINSWECEAELNVDIHDERNIRLSVRRYKSDPKEVGFFTYRIFTTPIEYEYKSKRTGLDDLGANFVFIQSEMRADEYVQL